MTNQQKQEDIGSRTNNIWSRGKIALIAIAAAGVIAGYALFKNSTEGCTYLGRDYPSWQARYKGGNNWYDPVKDYRGRSPLTPEGFRRLPKNLQGKCEGAISYKGFSGEGEYKQSK